MGAARLEPPVPGAVGLGKGGRSPSCWDPAAAGMSSSILVSGRSSVSVCGRRRARREHQPLRQRVFTCHPPQQRAARCGARQPVMKCHKANVILVRARQRQHLVFCNHSTVESLLDCQCSLLRACNSCQAAGGCVCCVRSRWS